MRKLILQMQISLDGFVDAAHQGFTWQEWDWGENSRWDDDLHHDFNLIFDSVSTILLSRPMLEGGYLAHWQHISRTRHDDPRFRFAQRVMDAEKVVISRRLTQTNWERTRLSGGPLPDTVTQMKGETGGQIICFGGTGFASALLNANLVDELQLFVNPTAIGAGSTVFAGAAGRGWRFHLTSSTSYRCGIVVNRYSQAREHPAA